MVRMMYFAYADRLVHDKSNMLQNLYFAYADHIFLVIEEILPQK